MNVKISLRNRILERALDSVSSVQCVDSDGAIGESVSWLKIVGRSALRAIAIRDMGSESPKAVAVSGDNSINLLSDIIAVILSGRPICVVNPINVDNGWDEVAKYFAYLRSFDVDLLLMHRVGQSVKQSELTSEGGKYAESGVWALPTPGLELSRKEARDAIVRLQHEVRAEQEPEVSVLQLSSGTTGSPKAIEMLGSAIAYNMDSLAQRLKITRNDRLLSWIPYHHAIGILATVMGALLWDASVLYMPTASYRSQPNSWLRHASQVRASILCAPGMAYRLAGRQLEKEVLDLSAVRLALVGGDIVKKSDLEPFIQAAAHSGLRSGAMCPMYGASEILHTTVAIPELETMDDEWKNRLGDDEVLSSGAPLPGVRLKFRVHGGMSDVGPGEIMVKTPGLFKGYRPFGNFPARKSWEWYQTGDVGYLKDNQLFVTSRIGNTVTVSGRTIELQQLEGIVSRACQGIVSDVVATVQMMNYGREGICLILEACESKDELARWIDAPKNRSRITGEVRRQSGAAIEKIYLVKPMGLPRTGSGKLQRHVVAKWIDEGMIEDDCAFEVIGNRVPRMPSL